MANPLTNLADWIGRRATRGLMTHVREARRVGGANDPGVSIVVTVENPQGENAFVSGFEVEMVRPFAATASRYEYRRPPVTTIQHLALNVPGHGTSEPIMIIAIFSQPVPYTSALRARVAAAGRGGFRRRWQAFDCPALEPS